MSQRLASSRISTARQLMAQGYLGQDLWSRMLDAFPDMTSEDQAQLRRRIASEHGILGQVLHDPTMYNNCHQARIAKKQSPNASLMILTNQTPYCDSCGYRRANQCGLMGGELVANSQDLPEGAVHRVAAKLESEGRLDPQASRRLRTSEVSPNRRVAALVSACNQESVSKVAEVEAQLDSNRAASIMAPGESDMNLKPKRLKGGRRASNKEAIQEIQFSANDRAASKEASSWADYMGSPGLVLDTSEINQPLRTASLDSAPLINYDPSQYETSGRRQASVVEEHSNHANQQLGQLMKVAGRVFGRGQMSVRLAANILDKAEVLKEQGGTLNNSGVRISHQLAVLVGQTADVEGDLS